MAAIIVRINAFVNAQVAPIQGYWLWQRARYATIVADDGGRDRRDLCEGV